MYDKKMKSKYTHTQKNCKCIESVLTSLRESCTAYLLIDERTGTMGTIQKL